jgi:hypothetical protein
MTMMMMAVPFSSNDGERDRFLLRHRDHRSRLSHLLYRYSAFFFRKVTLFSPFFLLKIGKSHTRFTHNNISTTTTTNNTVSDIKRIRASSSLSFFSLSLCVCACLSVSEDKEEDKEEEEKAYIYTCNRERECSFNNRR